MMTTVYAQQKCSLFFHRVLFLIMSMRLYSTIILSGSSLTLCRSVLLCELSNQTVFILSINGGKTIMKKIIGISGSPKENGNSNFALSYISSKICEELQMHNFYASKLRIEMCDGCLLCEDDAPCPKYDMMPEVLNALLDADIIVFVTPVYFDSLPATFKNILDRTNPLCNRISGKHAYIITFGQADQVSWDRATQCLENYLEVMGIDVVEKVSFSARLPGDVERNSTIMEELDGIAARIKEYAKG